MLLFINLSILMYEQRQTVGLINQAGFTEKKKLNKKCITYKNVHIFWWPHVNIDLINFNIYD